MSEFTVCFQKLLTCAVAVFSRKNKNEAPLFSTSRCFQLLSSNPSISNNEIINNTSNGTDFNERRNRLDKVCQKYAHPFRTESKFLHSDNLAQIRDFNYFWFNQGFTMICSIHKVGSNSMHNFLLHILEQEFKQKRKNHKDGLLDPEEIDEQTLPVSLDCWLECAKNHTKVIIVRHPLERLLSAYLYIFQNDGKYHMNKYSWEDFVHKIITNENDREWQNIQDNVGDHWEPYWHNCQVCDSNLKPNYILKLETMNEDLQTYLGEIGLTKYAGKFPWKNSSNKRGIHTSLRVIEFYSRLNRSSIEQLYEFYRLDHELFDYDPNYYLDFAYDNNSE